MMRLVIIGALALAGVAGFAAPTRRRASSRLRMGLFDDLANSVKQGLAEATQEVTVQHVLVDSKVKALQIERGLLEEGVTSESVGRAAQRFSTCGSAKKRPDARMAQLRGAPGELVFRRGQMDKAFEKASFEGPIGALQVVETQFGVHVLRVAARTGEAPAPPPEPVAEGDAPKEKGKKKASPKRTSKKGFAAS